jgi:predicted metal-dependent HD superfamily phosphohydrolase
MVALSLEFIRGLFTDEVSADYGYHNLEHTLSVFGSVQEIGAECQLTPSDLEVLQLAALFHDAGYCVSHLDHEMRGADMAKEFLLGQGYDAALSEQVAACIRATNINIEPENLLQEILCDADLSYLGMANFFQNVALLRLEWEVTLQSVYSEDEWRQVNINFFEKHHFYTSYAQEHYGKLKQKHLEQWRKAS